MDKDYDVNFEEEFDESYSDDEEMRQHQIKAREWQRKRDLIPAIDIRAYATYIEENNIPFEETRDLWKKFIYQDRVTEEQTRYLESEEYKRDEAESWEEALKAHKESKQADNEG